MKGKLLAALLLCALLLGCAETAPAREIPARLAPTKQTENDNLRIYPLDAADCRFLSFGADLLVLRRGEETAQLLRCTGRGLAIAAWTEVPKDSQIFVGKNRIGCYDPEGRQVLLFSENLILLKQFQVPECSGTPLLSADGSRIYYSTSDTLVELTPETGLHRLLRQQEGLDLTALMEERGLLVCAGEGQTLYIRVSDGTLEGTSSPVTGASAWGGQTHLNLRCGFVDCLYLGQTILPLRADWSFLTFLPAMNAAVVLREEKDLAVYDLSTGGCLAELPLGGLGLPEQALAASDGRIYFSAGDALCQWEPVWGSKRDNRISITALSSGEKGSEAGLAQCRQRGAYLENQYGLRLLLNEEAAAVAPKGVRLEPEHIPTIIQETLAGVEMGLGRFPRQLVRTAFSGGGYVYLCPVRSIRADGEEKKSLQYWSGRDCYLVIADSADIQQAVVEAFSPLTERQILMKSDAFDDWDSFNPPGFSYGSGEWDPTAFVSPDCLTSPSADRAGLLWAALEEGNREKFLSAQLQKKLRSYCLGMGQAFPGLEETVRPWEQYLWMR